MGVYAKENFTIYDTGLLPNISTICFLHFTIFNFPIGTFHTFLYIIMISLSLYIVNDSIMFAESFERALLKIHFGIIRVITPLLKCDKSV